MSSDTKSQAILQAAVDRGYRELDRQMWKKWRMEYPWHAESPTSVKPTLVPGNHASVLIRTGWRVWGFKTESERDTFVMQFGGRSV